jgi:aldehyde dehydrogenase (NAD+)
MAQPMHTPTIQHPDRLFIGGKWVTPTTTGQIDIISPNTEELVTRVADASQQDMDRAVAAARTAFDRGPWPRMAVTERIRVLNRLTENLKKRNPELGRAWTLQVGGLPMLVPHILEIATTNLTSAMEVGEQFPFEEKVSTHAAAVGIIVHEPVGVVAAITPWNAPYMLMTGKIAPALVAGCTVIMKPAPETPLEAYIIAECAAEAGLPEGVLNLVPSGREGADHLVRHPGVDKVSFTGSTAVGRHIASVCGERIARCTLELGGKSAAIVLDDFPIEEAAKLLTFTLTLLSGQVCAMLTRAIVSKNRYKALADAIVREMRNVRVGYSDEETTQMGPIAMKRQLARVESYIDKGKSQGATLATGGERPKHLKHGYFLEPTLFTDVDNRMTIAQEEIFGPVLCLIACNDTDDAIRIANDSIYGLNGAVLTRDVDAAYKVGRQVRTGSFGQNGMKNDFCLPCGGYKQSGIGREGGREGLATYLETKTLLLDGMPS